MSEGKHTPGAWEWDGTGMILRTKTGVNERGGMTGGVCIAQMWTKPSVADAALMVSAPDLVEALLQAREWLTGWASAERELAVIDAALSKAGVKV